MAFNQRKFKIRVQRFGRSKANPRGRVGLVSQRKIVVNGKTVRPGAKASQSGSGQLAKIVGKRTDTKAAKTTGKKIKKSVRR